MKTRCKIWLAWAEMLCAYAFLRTISFSLGQICERVHNYVLSFSSEVYDSPDCIAKTITLIVRSDLGKTILTKNDGISIISGSAFAFVFDVVDLFQFICLTILFITFAKKNFHIIFHIIVIFFILNISMAIFVVEKLSYFFVPFAGVLSNAENDIYSIDYNFGNKLAYVSSYSSYVKICILFFVFVAMSIFKLVKSKLVGCNNK